MSYTEHVFHNSRTEAVADLLRWYNEEDVELVELIDLGRTLRLTRSGEMPTDASPALPPIDNPLAVQEPVEAPEPVEAQKDAPAPETPPAAPEAPAIDLSGATRDQLKEIVVDNALDVTIPSSGPLGPVRDLVAEALAGKE